METTTVLGCLQAMPPLLAKQRYVASKFKKLVDPVSETHHLILNLPPDIGWYTTRVI